MRLVHSSRKRELLSVLAVLVLGLCASLLAAGHDADARPRRAGTVVPDGTYGGLDRGSGEYVSSKSATAASATSPSTPRSSARRATRRATEPRFFSAAHAPQGKLIPRNGNLHLEWQERGDGRRGNIGVTLRFGTRDFADLSVIVPEEPGSVRRKRSEGELRRRRHRPLPPRLRDPGAAGPVGGDQRQRL